MRLTRGYSNLPPASPHPLAPESSLLAAVKAPAPRLDEALTLRQQPFKKINANLDARHPPHSPGAAFPTREGIASWLAKLDGIIWAEAHNEVSRGQAIFAENTDMTALIRRGAVLPPARVHSVRSFWGSRLKVDLEVPRRTWNAGPHGQPIFRTGAKVELLREDQKIPAWTDEWLRTLPPKKQLKGTVVSNEKDTDLEPCQEDCTIVTILVPAHAWSACKPPAGSALMAILDVSISPYLRLESALERLAIRSGVPYTLLLRNSFTRLGDPRDDVAAEKLLALTKNKKAKAKSKAKARAKAGSPLTRLERAALNLTEFVLPHTPESLAESREQVIAQLPTPPLNPMLNTGQLSVIRDCLRMDEASVQLAAVKPKKPAAKGAKRKTEADKWAREHLQSIKAESHVLPFRLIHGPPGTGKTHTLVELVLQMALSTRPPPPGQEGKPGSSRRVLVAGPSNMSVDAIASRLLATDAPWSERVKREGVTFLRMGLDGRIGESVASASLDALLSNGNARQEERENLAAAEGLLMDMTQRVTSFRDNSSADQQDREETMFLQRAQHHARELRDQARKTLRQAESRAPMQMMRGSEVVISTLTSLHALINARSRFDVLIVDEASQAFEPLVLLALQCISPGGTLIMLGDPNQLPPSLSSHAQERAKELPTVYDTLHCDPAGKAVEVLPYAPMRQRDSMLPLGQQLQEVQRHASIDVDECLELTREAPSLPLTLFERLMTQYPSSTSMLSTQYRMNNDIMAFPAIHVYHGRLRADDSVATHALTDLDGYSAYSPREPMGHPLRIPGNTMHGLNPFAARLHYMDTSFCRHHEQGAQGSGRGSYSNEFEALWVAQHVMGLVNSGLPPAKIAVLTPYRGQVMLLRSMLRDRHAGMTVGSIDAMQGLEAEAVVLSMVRSNEARRTGFTSDPRRLNVAATRARRHLAIVGDGHTLSHQPRRQSPLLAQYVHWLRANAVVHSPEPQRALARILRAMPRGRESVRGQHPRV